MEDDTARGNAMPEQKEEIQKSVFHPGSSKPMSKAEFKAGDDNVQLAVLMEGIHKMKQVEIVAVRSKGLGSTSFEYQVKLKVDGEKAEVYKDMKGHDWFDEENLVRVMRKK